MADVDATIVTGLACIAALIFFSGGVVGIAIATGRWWLWIAAVVLTVAEVIGFVGAVKGWWY